MPLERECFLSCSSVPWNRLAGRHFHMLARIVVTRIQGQGRALPGGGKTGRDAGHQEQT